MKKKNKTKTTSGLNLDELKEMTSKKVIKESKGFSGGYVMVPKRGLHHMIWVLDWNSFYPNLMHNYQLCPSLLVLDPEFANLPNVKYFDIRF